MANPRFDARSGVIWSVNISHEARLLYVALDDMARDRGTWFIKQFDLGVRLGFSDRQLRRHVQELEDVGLVTCQRTGRSSLFTMLWIKSGDRSKMTDQEDARPVINDRSDRSKMTARSSRFLNTSSTYEYPGRTERTTVCRCGEYFQGEERLRCGCGAVHDPGTAAEVNPLEETRRMLYGYVQQCGLPWEKPDEEICVRTLNAAGSLPVLAARLRFLLLDRRQAPALSYAWFPRVVASADRRSA